MIIQPGVKISCNGRVGTLGLLVKRKVEPEKTYLMCCWHILDDENPAGTVILPDHNNLVIANYQRSESTAIKEMDVAIAELAPDHGLPMNNTTVDNARTIYQAAYWKNGVTLIKYGAATLSTQCQLVEQAGSIGNLMRGLKLAKLPGGDKKYCAHGDSGAVWCSSETGKAIGLHSKGFEGNLAAASPIIVILGKLQLTIV